MQMMLIEPTGVDGRSARISASSLVGSDVSEATLLVSTLSKWSFGATTSSFHDGREHQTQRQEELHLSSSGARLKACVTRSQGVEGRSSQR
jgi:hypothetical protein